MDTPLTLFHSHRSPLSQWHVHSAGQFVHEGHWYNCAEQYMMAEKARLFGNEPAWQQIMRSHSPREMQSLGRSLSGFIQAVWDANCIEIVRTASRCKFTQELSLRDALMATKGTLLVEAAPHDTRWGIGLSATDPRATVRTQWRGTNLLGYILSEVRDDLLCLEGLPGAIEITWAWNEPQDGQVPDGIAPIMPRADVGQLVPLESPPSVGEVEEVILARERCGDVGPHLLPEREPDVGLPEFSPSVEEEDMVLVETAPGTFVPRRSPSPGSDADRTEEAVDSNPWQPRNNCPLCKAAYRSVKAHVARTHLPWYSEPRTACWTCQIQCGRPLQLTKHIRSVHGGEGPCHRFDETNAPHYRALSNGLLQNVAEAVRVDENELLNYVIERPYLHHRSGDLRVPWIDSVMLMEFSGSMGVLPMISPPNMRGSLLYWGTLSRLLAYAMLSPNNH